MREVLVAALIFFALIGSAVVSLLVYDRLPPHNRPEGTQNVVKVATNLFVVMTSLVMGLMINSSKNTFEAVDRNIHVFGTELILLDKRLRTYGPDADDTRSRLLAYTKRALAETWPISGPPLVDDSLAEGLMNEAEHSPDAIEPASATRIALWREARQHLQRVIEHRWTLVEQSEGVIPPPLIVMLVAWLMLIFGSFGYHAPRNHIVVVTIVVSAALISIAVYFILDMDVPFSGPIQVSPAPMERAIVYMSR